MQPHDVSEAHNHGDMHRNVQQQGMGQGGHHHHQQLHGYQEQEPAAADYQQHAIDDQDPSASRQGNSSSLGRKGPSAPSTSRALPFVSSPRSQKGNQAPSHQQQMPQGSAQGQQLPPGYATGPPMQQMGGQPPRSLSPPGGRHMMQAGGYQALYGGGSDPGVSAHHMGMLGSYTDSMMMQQQQMMQRQQAGALQDMQQMGLGATQQQQQQQQQQQMAQQHAMASAAGAGLYYAQHRPPHMLLPQMAQDAWAAGAMQMGLPGAAHMASQGQMMDAVAAMAGGWQALSVGASAWLWITCADLCMCALRLALLRITSPVDCRRAQAATTLETILGNDHAQQHSSMLPSHNPSALAAPHPHSCPPSCCRPGRQAQQGPLVHLAPAGHAWHGGHAPAHAWRLLAGS